MAFSKNALRDPAILNLFFCRGWSDLDKMSETAV